MKKISPKRRTSLRAKVIRFLRSNRGFEEPSSDLEKIVHAGIHSNNYYNHQKEIETAWLEAERKKAQAIMEHQRLTLIR
ncbi:MAG: hypothetical protein JSV12_05470 [Candidatus Bathyarchaeota archaeon]|nr:MAG: hypothetical protein JSV12_05470 [Candidatus Bathyarchaeota archaeon]